MIEDSKFVRSTERNANKLVAWYLMAAYAYYVLDDPILSDATYDGLCKSLDYAWDSITHQHKHLVERPALSAATCLLAHEKYPPIVVGAVMQLLAAKQSGATNMPSEVHHRSKIIPLTTKNAVAPALIQSMPYQSALTFD